MHRTVYNGNAYIPLTGNIKEEISMTHTPLTSEDRALAGRLAAFYKDHLFNNVLPPWEARTADTEYGGYLHCFDRRWNLYDDEKYIWFQGRQIWMFSRLYRKTGDKKWLELARIGRDFVIDRSKAYAGGGRFNYQLDRTGQVIRRGTISIWTDFFILQALGEYILASGDETDLPLVKEMWPIWVRNTCDPKCEDIFHSVYDPRFFGYPMGVPFMATVLHDLLGDEVFEAGTSCSKTILYTYARDDYKVLFENLTPAGEVLPVETGTICNPGHTAETMWFVMDYARLAGEKTLISRAAEVLDWDWEKGVDHVRSGFYSFMNAMGGEPYQAAWHKETGARWDDKVWWANCEPLVSLSMAANALNSHEWFQRFLSHHEFTQKYFVDHVYGEWFSSLNADNTVKDSAKGSLWKAAYHLPRALLLTGEELEAIARGA